MFRNDKGRNQLLSEASEAGISFLRSKLTRVHLAAGTILEPADQPIKFTYFLESGLASVVASLGGALDLEVALIGCEGMTGTAALLGSDRSYSETSMLVTGSAMRIRTTELQTAMHACPALQKLLLRHVLAMMGQIMSTALVTARCRLNARLARWLLMAHDRLGGDTIAITHAQLSIALGVRRSGVTTALHVLEGEHFVRCTRGEVLIRDRLGLEHFAGRAYTRYEAERYPLSGNPSTTAAKSPANPAAVITVL
jgi:CRP-like cAMP-binding protein